MRTVFFVILVYLCLGAKGQTVDTIIVEDDPVVLTKKVYYTAPKEPGKTKLQLALGYPMATNLNGQFQPLSGPEAALRFGIEKNDFEWSIGTGFSRLFYDDSETAYTQHTDQKTYTTFDSSWSYTVTERPDPYQPDSSQYDTTWTITVVKSDSTADSVYYTSEERRITRSRLFLYIPFSVGYGHSFNKFRLGINLEGAFTVHRTNSGLTPSYLLGFSPYVSYAFTEDWSIGTSFHCRYLKKTRESNMVDNEQLAVNLMFAYYFR